MSGDDSRVARTRAPVAVFEKDVGLWDAEVEIHPGPGAPSLKMKAVSENRRIAGGRWLIVDYKADTGFEGHGVYGWDDARGIYVGTWVDSMQTAIARSEGSWDPATRTMSFVTEISHQGRVLRYREVTQTIEDGVQVYRNLVPATDGGEFEMIRATYRRRTR